MTNNVKTLSCMTAAGTNTVDNNTAALRDQFRRLQLGHVLINISTTSVRYSRSACQPGLEGATTQHRSIALQVTAFYSGSGELSEDIHLG